MRGAGIAGLGCGTGTGPMALKGVERVGEYSGDRPEFDKDNVMAGLGSYNRAMPNMQTTRDILNLQSRIAKQNDEMVTLRNKINQLTNQLNAK